MAYRVFYRKPGSESWHKSATIFKSRGHARMAAGAYAASGFTDIRLDDLREPAEDTAAAAAQEAMMFRRTREASPDAARIKKELDAAKAEKKALQDKIDKLAATQKPHFDERKKWERAYDESKGESDPANKKALENIKVAWAKYKAIGESLKPIITQKHNLTDKIGRLEDDLKKANSVKASESAPAFRLHYRKPGATIWFHTPTLHESEAKAHGESAKFRAAGFTEVKISAVREAPAETREFREQRSLVERLKKEKAKLDSEYRSLNDEVNSLHRQMQAIKSKNPSADISQLKKEVELNFAKADKIKPVLHKLSDELLAARKKLSAIAPKGSFY